MEKKVKNRKESVFLFSAREKKAFGERLGSLIPHRGVSEFARKTSISESSIRSLLTGKSIPRFGNLLTIAKTAGVTVEWLATGRGPRTYEGEVGAVPDSNKVKTNNENAVNEAPAFYGSKSGVINRNTAETIVNSMVEHGLVKEEWRTGIDCFVSIYNKTSDTSRSEHAIARSILEFQIRSYETQLHNLEVNGDGDVFQDYKSHLTIIISETKDKLDKLYKECKAGLFDF